jgi:hypothetical protein
MNRTLRFAPLLLLLPALAFAQSDLTWKMAFLKYTKGKMESVPFSRPLALADGDEFQLLVSPNTAAFVDVLYEDTTGEVTVLYQGATKAGQVVTLPAEKQNFQVSPPKGTEKLHVLVSTKPQASLEALFKGLPKNSRAVLDELTRIKTALLSVAEAPEKPVPMGGVSRGMPDVKITEFKGADSYAKTIRFDH